MKNPTRNLTSLAVVFLCLVVACGQTEKATEPPPTEVLVPKPLKVVATIEVGGEFSVPSAIAVGEGSVWVANFGLGRVVMIDPEQNETVGASPYVGAFDVAVGEGAVWFTNIDGNYVTRMDWTQQTTEQIDVGTAPSGVAVGEGAVWVANSDDGTCSKIEAQSGQVVATIRVGWGSLSDVAVGDGAVWVTNMSQGTVHRIDPLQDEGVGEPISVGGGPMGVAVGGGAVWVANRGDDTVSRIDPQTDAVVATIPVGSSPFGIAVGEGSVWVANSGDGTVSQVHPHTNELISTIPIGEMPIGVAAGEGAVWVLWSTEMGEAIVSRLAEEGTAQAADEPLQPPAPTYPPAPATPAPPVPEAMRQLERGWTSYTNANEVNDLAIDRDGNLWAVGSGGVVRWVPADGTYTTYTAGGGLADNHVQTVVVAPDGALWFGTESGVSRFAYPAGSTGDGKGWTTVTSVDGLASDWVLSAAVAPDGALWFGTEMNGVSRFAYPAGQSPGGSSSGGAGDGETWTTYTTADGLAGHGVVSIAVAPDGALWFATINAPTGRGGVSRFAYTAESTDDGQAWTRYSHTDGLVSNKVRSVTVASDGAVWFATNAGVSRLAHPAGQSPGGSSSGGTGDGQTWTTYTEKDGLVDNDVREIALAPDGALWFGTANGVSRFGTDGGNDAGTWTSYTTADGLVDNDVRSIAVSPGGTVWFGTARGVSRFTYSAGDTDAGQTWTTYTTDGLAANHVPSMAVAADGTLWFGTSWGVTRFAHPAGQSPGGSSPGGAADGQTWISYLQEDGLADNYIRAIAATPDGTLWFGTENGVTRYTYAAGQSPGGSPSGGTGAGQTWTTYTTDDGLADNYVQSVAVAPDGTVWFGTMGGGVSHLTFPAGQSPGGSSSGGAGDDQTWTTYTAADGLADDYVTSIVATPDGALWFATLGGVSRFVHPAGQSPGASSSRSAGDDRAWTTYTRRDGLASDTVQAAALAPDGALWFGTIGGVSRFDGQTWTTFTERDGLVDNRVETIAIAPDGTLWIGTENGVSRFKYPASQSPGGSSSGGTGDAKTWTSYTSVDGLAGNWVRSAVVAPDGALWFGTNWHGVSRWMPLE